MALSSMIDFRLPRIEDIEEIAPGHPVYRISFNDGRSSDLVVKIEDAFKRRHVTDPIKVMNAIDPQSETRQLKLREVRDLRTTLRDQRFIRFNGFASDLDRAVSHRPDPRTKKPVIIVMKAKANLINLDKAGQRVGNDKSGVKAIRKILNKPGSLEKLGKILAADAFNGNQDRAQFYPDPTGLSPSNEWRQNGQNIPLKALVNIGNFFFNVNGEASQVLGLDSVDPNSNYKDLDSFANGAREYTGMILRQDSGRHRMIFARNLVSDFEIVLGARNRKFPFSSQKHLPASAANSIVRGMESGAREVKTYVRNSYRNKPLSADLTARLNALGWMTNGRIN